MYIVITLPEIYEGETERIRLMFLSGLERLHLRKPGASRDQFKAILDCIPRCYHERIVIHDHFDLINEYNLKGIHLNSRNPHIPKGYTGYVSTSCHSIEELSKKRKEILPSGKGYDLLTLSPIYDSISKEGYKSAFTPKELKDSGDNGIIDSNVYALGGICHENIDEAISYGFGGVMVLGDAWRKFHTPCVLTIAGSDPSGGAGIQQDIRTMTSLGCYGASAITALTIQNTLGVTASYSVEGKILREQIRAVFDDIQICAVKIGMIPDRTTARVIIDEIRREKSRRVLPVIYDPVMISTSGRRLMEEDAIKLISEELFPLCILVTPNLPEYDYLKDNSLLENINAILIKGGHADTEEMTDTLYLKDENSSKSFTTCRIKTDNLHGTGCTLSSAIASYIAKGLSLEESISKAKEYIQACIKIAKDKKIGHGNGPLGLPDK